MRSAVGVFTAVVVCVAAVPAAADWDPGMPAKWVQEPDLDYTGIDVNATYPYVLADDFECRMTGPITDIHIWTSWLNDYLPFGENPTAVDFVLSIHADIPADPDQGIPYSRPGDVLWERFFPPGSFAARLYAEGDEGWLDPPDIWEPFGDTQCWQYNFLIDPAAADIFVQHGTPDQPIVYWLDVQATPHDSVAMFGWKTSLQHWNDDAVWGQGSEPYIGPWNELRYPPGHEFFPESIDLAFVITTEEEPQDADLGDAPDSSNNFGLQMTAYPTGMMGIYPTVYLTGSPPYGPIHWRARDVVYLGAGVSLEQEADIGFDEDGANNLDPPSDTSDMDMLDDGVHFPLILPNCQPTTFKYDVTVVLPPPDPLYVNVWFDWNQDGDWDDAMQCPQPAPEWAVQNQQLTGLATGVYTFTTPPFMSAAGSAGPNPDPIWMRITLSEQPWVDPMMTGWGGSGPLGGYAVGETEDYFLVDYIVPQPPVLIASNPAADGSLPKTQNNVVYLTFDQSVQFVGNPVTIQQLITSVPETLGPDLGGWFVYTLLTSSMPNDTIKCKENGAVLANQTWYRLKPTPGLTEQYGVVPAAPFVLDLVTLQGDCDGTRRITTADYSCVKRHMTERTDDRWDLNGSERVTTADYSVVKSHLTERAPLKP